MDFAFSWHCAVISVQRDSSASAGITIPVLPHSPFEKIALPISRKYLLKSGSAATISRSSTRYHAIMATFGSACALVGRLPLNEGSRSKFLLSTLSATWPPPRERQDLPLSRHSAKTPSGTIGCRSPLERSTANRRWRLGGGAVFLRRVGSEQGPKNFEKE